ncbi:MAG: TIGR00366 family protein, partial [Bacteroidales bacterium]|nr:TIGR00366 family protein [Bacteroidales bacterium]
EKECKVEWKLTPSEKLNNSAILSGIIAVMGLGYLAIRIFVKGGSLDLNNVIMLFLFLGIVLHKTPIKYVKAVGNSASAAAGILLQFPFYAGIMGIMTSASAEGVSLAGQISEACVAISNKTTFPMLSFLSAGIVNVFVPSGGGQWAVQAPIMLPAGVQLGVDPSVTGMAIAYGDAWTNLIQPFWALPALAIAKLDAKDIMGYCLIDLFVVAFIVVMGFLFLV